MALQTKVLVATESPRMTRLGGALILTPSPFSHDLVFNAGANSFLEVSHRKAPGLGLPTMQVQPKVLCGVVVSAGRMMKAVKVQTAKQVYNSFLKKQFQTYESHLVSDPTNSLRTGDVVRITSGWHASKHIRHRVTEIVAPWGPPIEERPKIPNDEELLAVRKVKKAAKMERRAQRREAGESGEPSAGKKSRPGGAKALMDVAK